MQPNQPPNLSTFQLTSDQVKTLESAGASVEAIEGVLTKAKAAGLDVSALEAELARYQTMRAGLLQHFRPGGVGGPRRG